MTQIPPTQGAPETELDWLANSLSWRTRAWINFTMGYSVYVARLSRLLEIHARAVGQGRPHREIREEMDETERGLRGMMSVLEGRI